MNPAAHYQVNRNTVMGHIDRARGPSPLPRSPTPGDQGGRSALSERRSHHSAGTTREMCQQGSVGLGSHNTNRFAVVAEPLIVLQWRSADHSDGPVGIDKTLHISHTYSHVDQ